MFAQTRPLRELVVNQILHFCGDDSSATVVAEGARYSLGTFSTLFGFRVLAVRFDMHEIWHGLVGNVVFVDVPVYALTPRRAVASSGIYRCSGIDDDGSPMGSLVEPRSGMVSFLQRWSRLRLPSRSELHRLTAELLAAEPVAEQPTQPLALGRRG